MNYTGSCHCGRIAFEVDGELAGELTGAVACNCSICRRKGALMWFVPRAALRLRTPASDMASYTFNKHVIKHRFCPHCGIHPFGEGRRPDGVESAAINVRCLDDVDIESLSVRRFDGRAL